MFPFIMIKRADLCVLERAKELESQRHTYPGIEVYYALLGAVRKVA
jgi:hypothetical protein